MNIVLSSDDNYARHLGQVMYSIIINNTDEERIAFYILNVGLSEDNLDKLCKVAEDYNREIHIIDLSDIESKLVLGNIPVYSFAIEAYTKFFLADMLPETEDRAMWIDGDADVLSSIHDMYYCDMDDYAIAAVVDQPNFGLEYFRKDAEIEGGPYVAIGMFVANLKYWRKINASKQFIDYFVQREGKLNFLEQATINHVLNNKIKILPIKYHVITPSFFLTYRQILKRWGEPFYSRKEYIQAKLHPVIVHYTVFRPWKKWCLHPKTYYYRKCLKNTPWKGTPLEANSLLSVFKGRIVSLIATIKNRK